MTHHTDYDTDVDWEVFAKDDPYFFVLTEDQYHAKNIDASKVDEFYRRGEKHVDRVLQVWQRHFGYDGTPVGTALDFGCGVGRLSLPLSRRAQRVIGLDVSPTMLDIARKRAAHAGIRGVDFLPSDDDLTEVEHDLGIVFSYIVFQHIPEQRGYSIVRRILERLGPGGWGYLHLTYADAIDSWRLRKSLDASKFVRRTPTGIELFGENPRPAHRHMQMNNYDLNRIMATLFEFDCHQLYVQQTHQKVCLGVELFFRRSKNI